SFITQFFTDTAAKTSQTNNRKFPFHNIPPYLLIASYSLSYYMKFWHPCIKRMHRKRVSSGYAPMIPTLFRLENLQLKSHLTFEIVTSLNRNTPLLFS